MKSATMEREPDLSSISILTEFDDLVRNEKVLNEGSERQFLKFVNNCELNRRRWEQSEHECQRLSIELTKASHEITGLETKLHHARIMFDKESQARKLAESERDRLANQLQAFRQLIMEADGMDEGTLRKMKNFESVNDGGYYGNVFSPGLMREAANCRRFNQSEGSVLDVDDLSFDEDTINLCESRTRSGASFRKLNTDVREARKRSRSRSNPRRSSLKEPINLEDRSRKRERRSRSVGICDKVDVLEITPRITDEDVRIARENHQQMIDNINNDMVTRNNNANDLHDMEEKTEMKSNKCSTCLKRIKFGKIYHKCRHCKLLVHKECVPNVRCVPVNVLPPQSSPSKVSTLPGGYLSLSRTPSKKEQRQMFASPMLK